MEQVMPSSKRQISPAMAKGPRASGEMSSMIRKTGEEITKTGLQIGAVLGEIGQRRKNEHDTATAQDAFDAFRNTTRSSVYDYLGKKGADAAGSKDGYQSWYEKEAGTAYNKLQNKQQQLMFETLARRRLNSDLETLSRHEAAEHFAHLKNATTATRVRIVKDVMVDPFNDTATDELIEEGAASISLSNPGKNNSADIAQMEMDTRKAAFNEMIRIDPVRARDTINTSEDKWKDGLGTAYTSLKETAELEATYVEAKDKEDLKGQIKFVEGNSGLSDKSKRTVVKRLKEDQTIEKAQQQELIKETENQWFDDYNDNKLSAEEIQSDKFDYMPVGARNSWISKVDQQTKDLKTTKTTTDAENTKDTFAVWAERVDLETHDWNESDIYADVDPNNGGLTGNQATYLRDRLAKNKVDKGLKVEEKAVKAAVKSAKTKIKAMYDRGDFGSLSSKKGKARAKTEKADAMIALEDWMQAHPTEDPTEWFDSYMDLQAAEKSVNELSTWWEDIVPGTQKDQRLKNLASGDMDNSIARRMLTEKGYDVTKVSDEQMEQVILTKDFNVYKTRMLQQ